MMIRTAPKAELSLRNLATLVIGIVGLGAVTVAMASSSSSSEDIGNIMHRAQAEQTTRGFAILLGTLGEKPQAEVAAPAASVMPVSKTAPVKLRSQQNA